MAHKFLDLVSTPSVRRAQEANGSREAYARLEGGEATYHRLTERETEFIAARDSFYMASVSQTGWPYVQHRGGPAGFLRVLDENTIAFADFRGNRQYVSVGNIDANDRVSLILMDYPNRRRLKILGRARAVELGQFPVLAARLATPEYKARPERALLIEVEAFDWNCPQHITPRFTEAQIAEATAPLRARVGALEHENEMLRAALARQPREAPL
ncbi:MAG: pyridoxamine 5'-phosphate oxidase family protein [Pseudomonadota bacterium]|nr:pyridoxamine 5'-phosphate oxidase family protein [Pseudomonadota bacterium]